MSYTVKISENEKAVLKIIQDNDARCPRVDMDNLGTMVCWHSRYDLGDKHSYNEPREFIEELVCDILNVDQEEIEESDMEDLIGMLEKEIAILPLFLYDHSGITMNTTGFTCRWDSGQVGWIYITAEDIINEYGSLDIEKAKSYLKAEVETYDMYLRGDIYGYVLEEKAKCDCCENVELNEIDSCWGFYGLEYLEEELQSMFGQDYPDLIENLEWAS